MLPHKNYIPSITYYQAESEVKNITSVHPSYLIYAIKEICQKDFPESNILNFHSDDIQSPIFFDVPEIVSKQRNIVEFFEFFSEGAYNSNKLEEVSVFNLINPFNLPSYSEILSFSEEITGSSLASSEFSDIYKKIKKHKSLICLRFEI